MITDVNLLCDAQLQGRRCGIGAVLCNNTMVSGCLEGCNRRLRELHLRFRHRIVLFLGTRRERVYEAVLADLGKLTSICQPVPASEHVAGQRRETSCASLTVADLTLARLRIVHRTALPSCFLKKVLSIYILLALILLL